MNDHRELMRIVIKIGTSTLTAGGKQLCLSRMVDLVRQIHNLKEAGHEIVLVSSGGIAAGREVLDFPDLAHYLPAKQMLAAVGQPRLMAVYKQLFSLFRHDIAQVLLTRDDLLDRRRYLNARNTLEALLAYQIIPVINENDTIATEEIRFGDNDQLSALVTTVLEADYLLLLTDQDGVFTSDPATDPRAELVKNIENEVIPDEILRAASESRNELGTGGMASKLQAAQLARRSGAAVIIANGATDNVLTRLILDLESLGTYFSPLGSHLESRKRFLLAGITDATGRLFIDDGAAAALRKGGSLLPVGIVRTEGQYSRGQSVIIKTLENNPVAVGLCNYSVEDVVRILGQQSDLIESLLGYAYGSEVVHHNNLVLL